MGLQIRRGELLSLPNAPDVAHHATAIALVVGKDNQYRQGADNVQTSGPGLWNGRDGNKWVHSVLVESVAFALQPNQYVIPKQPYSRTARQP